MTLYEATLPLALVIAGLLLAFIGKKLLKIMVMLGGGFAFAYVVYRYSGALGVEGVASNVAALLAFIVGAFLAWFLVKLVLTLAIGFALGYSLAILLGLTSSLGALVLLILFSIAIAYIIAEKMISIALTLLGVAFFYIGAEGLATAYIGPEVSRLVVLGLAVILFIVAAAYHLRKK